MLLADQGQSWKEEVVTLDVWGARHFQGFLCECLPLPRGSEIGTHAALGCCV